MRARNITVYQRQTFVMSFLVFKILEYVAAKIPLKFTKHKKKERLHRAEVIVKRLLELVILAENISDFIINNKRVMIRLVSERSH